MNLKIALGVIIQFFLSISYAKETQTFSDKWAVHIEGGERVARSLAEKHGFTYLGKIMDDIYHFQHRQVAKRSTSASSHHHTHLVKEPQVKWLEQQVVKKRVKRNVQFNDPYWNRMWYLNRNDLELTMNVIPAWENGFSGKGVVVTILDDGIEKDHPDLEKNYDSEASYDVNGNDDDPQPRYDFSNENRHGTRCAGEVAASSNNNVCSVGIAYDANIGGVRMLDGDVTDAVEATSLSLRRDHIDIYSASWGPDDDGRTVDGPATLAKKAFKDGVSKGRQGLGSIFVWASGNGGRDDDSCNCDGYTNSIYTLSISSTTESGNIPWYSEACSSTLATTYSSGSGNERQIVTTDLRKACTESHTGTSASAPLAAGICALALQANPNLSWRDLQHIVVMTAKPHKLRAGDWTTNGVGRKVSHSFGYGLMDASAMASMAKNWTSVPKQLICEIPVPKSNRAITARNTITVSIRTDACFGTAHHVRYLEHVQAKITLSSEHRGAIQIFLTSPSGTRSTLLAKRARDTSKDGFGDWAFMTTHNWGENAEGKWTLEVENSDAMPAELKGFTLVLHGTSQHPLSNYNDSQKSSGCTDGMYALGSDCLETCPGGYYPSTSTRNNTNGTLQLVCKVCNVSCQTCSGPTPQQCLTCHKNYIQSKGACVPLRERPMSYIEPKVIWMVAIAILFCVSSIVLFLLIFFLFQAYSNGYLFWRNRKANGVDAAKGEYRGLKTGNSDKSLLDSETEDDLDDTSGRV
ncbi:furin isoform X2 [Lingula anatina]|uniref:Furin isoform X2 n=1 Tax=Lingula anatina TaxID=7574 RepID=A0A1S3HHW3_LINAN|nr:furin isoform X2 [Lingula anatina]|eukprot:XP_013384579.1 furin isoform X2 [Lingula anatina]